MELKCPLTIDEQLERLVEHGITIDNPEEAKAFLEYLKGEDASKVFESVGFSPLAKK